MSLLEVDKINTLYGDSHVLFDLSIRVEQGEVVALLGPCRRWPMAAGPRWICRRDGYGRCAVTARP
jgi:hypothetical protein